MEVDDRVQQLRAFRGLILQPDPALYCAHVISKVRRAGGLDAGKYDSALAEMAHSDPTLNASGKPGRA